jgi:hypothetical protein
LANLVLDIRHIAEQGDFGACVGFAADDNAAKITDEHNHGNDGASVTR